MSMSQNESIAEENNSSLQEIPSSVHEIAKELEDIRDQSIQAGLLIYDEAGKFQYAVAPNGERSNLTEKQWLQVRLSSFQHWFGDWQRDPRSSSQIVDSNGEPQVCYHGTTREFTVFSHSAKKNYSLDNTQNAFYALSNREFAEDEYGKFKFRLWEAIIATLNFRFFEGKMTKWDPLIEKWNDFVRSIGTERVNFEGKVPDRRGGFYPYTVVQFDGVDLIDTEEFTRLWDGEIPPPFIQENYEQAPWQGKVILFPRNFHARVMSLFINSRKPNNFSILKNPRIREMDELFEAGLIQKGLLNTTQQHILNSPEFGSKSDTDSIVVTFPSRNFAIAVFDEHQLKSATDNGGNFNINTADLMQ